MTSDRRYGWDRESVGPRGRAGGASRPESVRAFLALLIPPRLVDAALGVQEELRSLWPQAPVRWVSPQNLHLTVRFFGDLGPVEQERAAELVRTSNFVPIEVRLDGCSAFPSESRPGVLWVGLTAGGGALAAWVRGVEARIEAAGFGPPDKPWQSHLTLGRVPREPGLRARPEQFRSVRLPKESFQLEAFALVKSELRREGPKYTPIEIVGGRGPERLGI